MLIGIRMEKWCIFIPAPELQSSGLDSSDLEDYGSPPLAHRTPTSNVHAPLSTNFFLVLAPAFPPPSRRNAQGRNRRTTQCR